MGFESSAFGLGNTSEEVRNPITAFNFVLEVEGVYFLPLKSVRAFTKENEYEYIKEGGVNDYVHMKRKPISKPFTFQIERYVGTERFLDPLANGTELILPLILHVYRHAAMRGFTALPDASPARLYTFTGCTVISKEYGELNSERSGILTEVTTIAYRELMVVTNCFTSTEKDRWFMNGGTVNGEKIGNKKVKFATQANNDKLDIYTKNKLGFTVRADDAAINMPPWDGSMGRQTKYAKDSAFDGDNTPYKMVDVGDLFTWVKRAGVPLNKPAWTGENGAVVAHATEQLGDKGDGYPYERGDVGDVKNTWIMKDKMSFKKPAYEFRVDQDKLKYAQEALVDKNATDPIYKKNEDGSLVRADSEKLNKPAWTGKEGAKTYAAQAAPDKANDTYMYGADGEFMRVDNKPYNKAPWNGEYGSIPIWATMAKPDMEGGAYSRGEDGYLSRTDEVPYNKPAWTGKKGSNNQWATPQANDLADNSNYTKGDVGDIKNTLIMKEGKSFAKPQYQMKSDMNTLKYAQMATIDKNAGNKIYEKGENGITVRSDNAEINKPAWTGKEGAKTYATQANPDKANDTYMYGADGEFMRVDNKPYNKAPWNGEYGSIPIWATMATPDMEGGAYSRGEDGYLSRIDKASYNKKPWTGAKGTTNQWAKPQTSTASTPPKAQYELKKDGTNNKWAKVSTKDKEKPVAKPQYELQKNMTQNLYATVSPTDGDRAPQVIWPPTRRALMADTLSKK